MAVQDFIGYHLSNYFCEKYKNIKIFGFDNLDNFTLLNIKKKELVI